MSTTPAGPVLPVVIVHREQPARCVKTARVIADQGVAVRIVVADNGSSEAALSQLRAELPTGSEILELGANTGFGPGANAGIRYVLEQAHASDAPLAEWVALAPHDALPEPGCLPALLAAATNRPRAGLASAEFGHDLVPVVDPYFGGIELPATRGEGWQDAGFPHGTLMLLRRDCLAEVGMFDERYFAYVEEADLAERARRAGWEVGIVWGAVVRNPDLSTPVPAIEYLQVRNSLMLVRRFFGRYRTFIRLCFLAVNTARLLARPSQRTPYFDARARRLAVADFLAGRTGPPPEDLMRRP